MKNLILSITALFITLSASSQTIVDAAASNKDFSTLVTALKAADLVGALSSEGPFTVFAPNNDALSSFLWIVQAKTPQACPYNPFYL